MTEVSFDQLPQLVLEQRSATRTAAERQLVLATVRELAKGAPVTRVRREELATELGLEREQAAAAMAAVDGAAQVGSDGEVRAVLGLSIDPAAHRFAIGGRQLYTWCALDTTFLPILLNATADVETICPVSGVSLGLRIAPDGVQSADPDTTVLSVVLPPSDWVSDSVGAMRSAFCDFSLWFHSEEEARNWVPAQRRHSIIGWRDAGQLGREWAEVISHRR